mmetsp:Transcript_41992/g.30229  ORF Transcript_41992/g.30229 Transcript_41992/m.30229 type:complete len:82 (-) Transcript_41992:178-423(-)
MLAMFNKVSKLSMKSITKTNSGKLITLISSDLLIVEKGLAFSPLIFSSIVVNLLVFVLIAAYSSFADAFIVLGTYLFLLIS